VHFLSDISSFRISLLSSDCAERTGGTAAAGVAASTVGAGAAAFFASTGVGAELGPAAAGACARDCAGACPPDFGAALDWTVWLWR